MRKLIANKLLKDFEQHYDYDVSYMRYMLEGSPQAFFGFSKLMDLSKHREAAPIPALYAAKIVGAVTEDCGPCVQLVVQMAREAGMPDDQITAVLKRSLSAMSDDTRLGFQFADAVVKKSIESDVFRARVREVWGDAGVIDLTFGVQIGRIYPMMKDGLGFAKSCSRVTIDGAAVEVVKSAA